MYKVRYQDVGGGVVEAGAGGGEADAAGEVADAVGGVEVGGDERREAEGLGDEVGGDAAVAEPPGGPAGEVAAVGPEVALQHGADGVVVAGVHRRVAEHDDSRDGRGGGGGGGGESSNEGEEEEENLAAVGIVVVVVVVVVNLL